MGREGRMYTWLAGPAASCLYRHGSEQEIEDLDEMIPSTRPPSAAS